MAQKEAPSFTHYQPAHRDRLRALAQKSEWQGLLTRRDALRQWQVDTRVPPAAPSQQMGANEYLRERNAERAKKLLRQGVTDEGELVDVLGDWETALAGDDRFPIVFLGLVLTLDCVFTRRCLYCNQTWLPRRLTLDDWKALLREAADPIPPYVYLTGGEPLLLGAEVWGDDGLVAFASELGCAVNDRIDVAVKYEKSEDVSDWLAENRYGVVCSYLLSETELFSAGLALEYMKEDFGAGAEDADLFTMQLALEF